MIISTSLIRPPREIATLRYHRSYERINLLCLVHLGLLWRKSGERVCWVSAINIFGSYATGANVPVHCRRTSGFHCNQRWQPCLGFFGRHARSARHLLDHKLCSVRVFHHCHRYAQTPSGRHDTDATDLDINADGFNWDVATRQGSRGLVVWSSTNLVDWSEPALRM